MTKMNFTEIAGEVADPFDTGPGGRRIQDFMPAAPPNINLEGAEDRLMHWGHKLLEKSSSADMARRYYNYINNVAWPSYISTDKNQSFDGWVKDELEHRSERWLDRQSIKHSLNHTLEASFFDAPQNSVKVRPDPFGTFRTQRGIANDALMIGDSYQEFRTAFDPKWMRRVTLGYLYQVKGILIQHQFKFKIKPLTDLEQVWHFYRLRDDNKTEETIDFVVLRGNYFCFDFIINKKIQPGMTMNPMRKGQRDQGVPLSMNDKNFRGWLTPIEAYLYMANWRGVLDTLRHGIDKLVATVK